MSDEVSRLLSAQIEDLRSDMNRRFDEIGDRLDAGDTRFKKMDERNKKADEDDARRSGMIKVATWVGGGVLTSAGLVGSYFLSYVPELLKWLVSKP